MFGMAAMVIDDSRDDEGEGVSSVGSLGVAGGGLKLDLAVDLILPPPPPKNCTGGGGGGATFATFSSMGFDAFSTTGLGKGGGSRGFALAGVGDMKAVDLVGGPLSIETSAPPCLVPKLGRRLLAADDVSWL